MKKDKLYQLIREEIHNVMNESVLNDLYKVVPDEYGYDKLAVDIATFFKEEYGSHLNDRFMSVLGKTLKASVTEASNEMPDKKDLSIINRGRAKAALKQIKTGKRSDGMPGPFTARLFGITSSGDVHQITDEDALNQYSKFGLAEATDTWKRFDMIQNLRIDGMDIERAMAGLAKQIKQVHKDMEQEAEPAGGKVANKYGNQLNKLTSQYKKKKTELNKLLAKLDKLEQY